MTLKEHFFVSRLVTFNETFASLNNTTDYVVLWHEGIAGRCASDVASAYMKCINLCEKDNVVFWADNCTGQNKNWVLFTALCWCVNQNWGPKTITLKFLERGHTFMRADSIHGNIGSAMRKRPNIYTFDDFVDVCDGSAKKIRPVTLGVHDFYEFEDGHRARTSKTVTLPLLNKVKVIKFQSGSRSMWFINNFNGQFEEVDFLKVTKI